MNRNLRLHLTQDEQQQLEDMGEKYAELLWNIAMPAGGSNDFTVDKSDAWEWKEVVDSTRGFLPRAQGNLKQKLQAFYERIG